MSMLTTITWNNDYTSLPPHSWNCHEPLLWTCVSKIEPSGLDVSIFSCYEGDRWLFGGTGPPPSLTLRSPRVNLNYWIVMAASCTTSELTRHKLSRFSLIRNMYCVHHSTLVYKTKVFVCSSTIIVWVELELLCNIQVLFNRGHLRQLLHVQFPWITPQFSEKRWWSPPTSVDFLLFSSKRPWH